jgi:hypothetical protein
MPQPLSSVARNPLARFVRVVSLTLLPGCGTLLVPGAGELDFGEVLIGESSARPLTVTAEDGTVVVDRFRFDGADRRAFGAQGLEGATLADKEAGASASPSAPSTSAPRRAGSTSA